MADQSISLGTGASLEGRALASNAAVTLASNVVNRPVVTAVENGGVAPQEFALFQNYPNPFNPSTKIQYTIGNAGLVSLKVYDVLGHEVATLVNSNQEAGSYTVPFNTSEAKLNLSSGVYFYRLEAGSFVAPPAKQTPPPAPPVQLFRTTDPGYVIHQPTWPLIARPRLA